MTPETTSSKRAPSRTIDAVWTIAAASCGAVLLLAAVFQLTRPIAIEPASERFPLTNGANAVAVVRHASRRFGAHPRVPAVVIARKGREAIGTQPHVVARRTTAGKAAAGLHATVAPRIVPAPAAIVPRAIASRQVASHSRAVTPKPSLVLLPRATPPKHRVSPRSISAAMPEPPLGYDPTPELTQAVAAQAESIGTAFLGARVRGREIMQPAIPIANSRP